MATASSHIKTDVLERDRSRKALADATKADGGIGSFGTQGNKLSKPVYGLGGGGKMAGDAAISNESVGTETFLPDSNDLIAA